VALCLPAGAAVKTLSPMRYVDGFVLAVPTKKLAAYRRIAQQAGKVWRRHGAVEYLECVGEDLEVPCGIPFPKLAKVRRGESVLFSFIVYRSRAHRDRVNAKVMQDPAIVAMMGRKMPFDMDRMTHGGFKALVDL
jgi:uncharacterized protein YbaA (DUF1428 family)